MVESKDFEKTGKLWKNQYKTSSKHPHFKGFLTLNGKKWDCAIWCNEDSDSISMKISEPYVKPEKKESIVEDFESIPEENFPF